MRASAAYGSKVRPAAMAGCMLAFATLMSIPWLVPHMGWTALLGLVPLLVMERLATQNGIKHFWWWHYGAFVLWNAATTWWVGNATVGGAVFAVLANALQMSVVFGAFRWVKRRTGGILPYLFLAAAWIAWERWYLTSAQISWPWLVLGNAFAGTTSLVQWYSVLGSLGGSLWVWAANLSIFGLMVALSNGRFSAWNGKARSCALAGTVLALFGPMVWSLCIPAPPAPEASVRVVIGQPSLDPYHKFESLTQEQQDSLFLSLVQEAFAADSSSALILAPETQTWRVYTDDIPHHPTFMRFQEFLQQYPSSAIIYGASTYDPIYAAQRPHLCAYDMGPREGGVHLWLLSHNSAISAGASGLLGLYHKSKLVVGTELTPYPSFFVPLENLLGGGLMAKDLGQDSIACLPVTVTVTEPMPTTGTKTAADVTEPMPNAGTKNRADITEPMPTNGTKNRADVPLVGIGPEESAVVPVGTAICYESVYGEHCAGYVRAGAQMLAVITNDSWWGNTPGYKQHFNYSRLRAIETRRWVARCGNSGISGIIDPSGRVLDRTPWWVPTVLQGSVGLSTQESFFVRYGDMVGRICVFLFLLLLAAALFRPR